MPIEQLELSQRTYNCLKRSQVTKVGQILQMSEDELLSLRNFGQKSLVELRQKLREHGVLPEAEEGEEVLMTGDEAEAEAEVETEEPEEEEA